MRKFLVVVLAVICLGCTSLDVRQSLEDVESYIMERPDSALAVLDSMDRSLLSSDRTRAHHALLYAMALDKNFIDVSDDSIARVAVDYYSRRGSDRHYARSLYYLGIAYFYQGAYDKSILELTKAEKESEKCDSLYLGFSLVGQANCYNKTYNPITAVQCLEKSNRIFHSLSMDYYAQVSQLELACAYSNLKDYTKAEELFANLLENDLSDDRLYASILARYAFLKSVQSDPDYKASCELYGQCHHLMNGLYMGTKDYWVWAYALRVTGKVNDSENLVRQLTAMGDSSEPYWMYRLSELKGDDFEALINLKKATVDNNSTLEEALRQSLASVQKDFYRNRYEFYEYQSKMNNHILIFVISICILVVLILLLLINKYIIHQKNERNNLLEYVAEVNRQLEQAKNYDYESLKNKYIALYKSRFEAVGELCCQYIQHQDRADLEKVIFNKVMLMVEEIRNDKVRKAKFEAILDAELDGIMSNFRCEMPRLKENDITLFCYLVAGFDSTTISRLMDMSINNVYAHKRRLKLKIEEKNPPHSSEFLEMIV